MGKNVGLAVLLNFLVPGLGYVYNGKRIKFGIGIFLFHLFLAFFYPLTKGIFFLSVVWFAYWAGKEVEKINEMEKVGKPYKVEYPELIPKNLGIYSIILLIGGAFTHGSILYLKEFSRRAEEMKKEMLERIGITIPSLEEVRAIVGEGIRVNNLEFTVERFDVSRTVVLEKEGKKYAIDYWSFGLGPGNFILVFSKMKNVGKYPFHLNSSPAETIELLIPGKVSVGYGSDYIWAYKIEELSPREPLLEETNKYFCPEPNWISTLLPGEERKICTPFKVSERAEFIKSANLIFGIRMQDLNKEIKVKLV